MAYTVDTNQIAVGTEGQVTGNVSFSHASRKMTLDEIKKENDRRRGKPNMSLLEENEDKSYSYIEIANVKVKSADINAPTPMEIYLREHAYQTPNSKKHPNAWCFTGKHSGKGLATVFQLEADGKTLTEVKLEPGQELDEGLNVTLVLKCFKPKNHAKNGIALEAIIVNEPIRYYQAKTITNSLASQGYIISGETKNVSDIGTQVTNPEAEQQAIQQTVQQAVQQTPPMFSYAAPAQGAPVQQTPPVQAAAPVQQGAPMTAPTVAPATGVPTQGAQQVAQNGSAFGAPQQAQGITYDPNNDRPY